MPFSILKHKRKSLAVSPIHKLQSFFWFQDLSRMLISASTVTGDIILCASGAASSCARDIHVLASALSTRFLVCKPDHAHERGLFVCLYFAGDKH